MFNQFLRLHSWKNILSVFQKLNAKKRSNFYWDQPKVPHVAQKDFFQKLKPKYKQNEKNWRKNRISAYVQFYKTKFHRERGVEYMNYQKEVAMLTDFWQRKAAERSKNEITRQKSEN